MKMSQTQNKTKKYYYTSNGDALAIHLTDIKTHLNTHASVNLERNYEEINVADTDTNSPIKSVIYADYIVIQRC